ncbi:MAG: DUF4349 domain-containing protein [Actinobacteria bacterium]|nr:DUF4349 domain-containing protein [Actinomycetota bacterium]
MTDDKRQQELMDMIERLLAGESIETAGADDEEIRKLLLLAGELQAGAPEPSPEFEQRLKAGLEGAKSSRRWVPQWLTLPRLAAAAVVLVIALGVTGLTVSLINGGYRGGTAADMNAASSEETPGGAAMQAQDDATRAALGQVQTGSSDSASGPAAGAAEAGPATGPAAGGDSSAVQPLPPGQKVVQTADYRIEIAPGEFNDKYSQVTALAAKYGGYVVSGDTRSSGEGLASGVITIRIANTADNFSRAQAEIDGIGNVVSRKIAGQDVTDDYVDLQSRLRNAQTEEAQLLALMQKAQTMDEILMVQSRLSDIRSQIEQIQGRIKSMESRTDFATITVDLRETAPGQEPSNGIDWGFAESVRYAGWLSVQTLNFVIKALGLIVPVALLAAIVYLLAARVLTKPWRKS